MTTATSILLPTATRILAATDSAVITPATPTRAPIITLQAIVMPRLTVTPSLTATLRPIVTNLSLIPAGTAGAAAVRLEQSSGRPAVRWLEERLNGAAGPTARVERRAP